jgi:hypothetical protein
MKQRMIRLLALFLGGVIATLPLHGASSNPVENPLAVRLSPAGQSYIDPEFLSSDNKMAFQTSNGEIWLSDLDPITGLFNKVGGKDLRVDTHASPLLHSFNGPEFGIDSKGWSLFYTKPNGGSPQIWRASINDGSVSNQPLTSGSTPRLSCLASKDPKASETIILYSKGKTLNTGSLTWTRADQPSDETVLDILDRGVRWIDETQSFVYIKQSGPKKGQLFLYDALKSTEKQITQEDAQKSYSYGWIAPEYDELLMMTILDKNQLVVYRDMGGKYWDQIVNIPLPAEAKYACFASPEPFVAGGKSYISCVITSDVNRWSLGEVWIFGLQQGKNSSFARKMEDGLGDAVRTDPETYIGSREVFVYYNVITPQRVFEIYRVRTGIVTLEDPAMNYHRILPSHTDSAIDGINEPHYVLSPRDKEAMNHKLLVFFPGSNARPYDYLKFCSTAVEMGYHVVSLSYENSLAVNFDLCPGTTDVTCHGRARYEIFFGKDCHPKVEVNPANAIVNRLEKLLRYLDKQDPEEQWGLYLSPDEQIFWEKIVTAGHSQGGGHAAFASKYFKVARVIMFAATDWAGGRTAEWIRSPGPTEAEKYYGFIHTGDVPIYNVIVPTWRDYGMMAFGRLVKVEDATHPYEDSHTLISSLSIPKGVSAHNFPIVDFATPSREYGGEYLYSEVWRYLMELD